MNEERSSGGVDAVVTGTHVEASIVSEAQSDSNNFWLSGEIVKTCGSGCSVDYAAAS
jgi:hypothetical protein